MGESLSDKLSHKFDEKSARHQKKESKALRSKRYKEKKIKYSKVLKTSEDKSNHSS